MTTNRFVVRTPDGWWVAGLDGAPARVDLAAVIAEGIPVGVPPAPGGSVELAPTGSVWRSSWMWIGRLGPDGVLLGDVGTLLDAADLAVVDVLGRDALGIDEVARRAGSTPEDAARRLARLGAIGAAEPGHRTPVPIEVVAQQASVPTVVPPSPRPAPSGPAGRVPVYAVWQRDAGPLLSLGMLTAALRHHDGGSLSTTFEIRRPETVEEFLADQLGRSGPAVLLCSDYVWSIAGNLAAARQAMAHNPELLVVHGGPSCPKYEADAARFLDEHGDVAHVLVRGEGEHTLPELLRRYAGAGFRLDPDALADLGGLTFRGRDGTVVRTAEPDRVADLDELPSPYLSGEFDDIDPDAWRFCLSIETTRGCPYGCSFCDWGSATLSRIRKFDPVRVAAEIEWAAVRGVNTINLTDANFGIVSRDVDTAGAIADVRRRTGFPRDVAFYPAKNTTRHLAEIMDTLLGAGILPAGSLSLQTSDPDSLDAVARSNISTDHYVALAAVYRRRGLPLHGDLLIGIPAQTFDSFRRDLQFNVDHEIMSRTWQVQLLPNAPMNDVEYRRRHGIRSDEAGRVMETASFGPKERERMLRLRRVDIIFERYGVARHLIRVLQWDHGVDATAFEVAVLDAVEAAPERYPLLAWLVARFDRFPAVPVGWSSFYDEVERFVADELGVPVDSGLTTAFALQRALMPAPGRTFPHAVELAHDYLGYYRDATAGLYGDGHAGRPSRPLTAWGPATFVVESDPLGLCTHGMRYPSESHDATMEDDFVIGGASAYELGSELLRFLPWVAAHGLSARIPPGVEEPADGAGAGAGRDEPESHRSHRVILRRRADT